MQAFATPLASPLHRRSLTPVTSARPPQILVRPRTTRCTCCSSDKPSETPEAIRALLTSKGKAEQQRGLLLVRRLPPAAALELLLLSVQTSANEFIRSSAAIAIGQLPLAEAATRDGALSTMVSLLATDSDYSVRAAAAAGMGYASPLTREAVVALREALTRALLEDSEWQVQFSCLVALGGLGDDRSIPVLSKWLRSDNDLLVQAAVGALGDIGDPRALPDLLKLLGNTDMMTRQRLAQALGQIATSANDPAAIDALRTLSKDQAHAVRDAATQALSTQGREDAVKGATSSEVGRSDSDVENATTGDERENAGVVAREEMRQRLERSFDKEATSAPSSASNPNETEEARSQQRNEIGGETEKAKSDATERNEEGKESSNEVFEDLVNDLKHGNVLAQTMAAIRLRKFDGKRAASAVLSSGTMNPAVSSERLRSVAVALLARGGESGKIIDVLRSDPDQNVRSACCDALTDVDGGGEAVEACTEAFKTDKHWLVRASAAIALGAIGKGYVSAEDALINSLRPGGLKDLREPQDTVVRRHAVTALGFLGSKRSLGAISALLQSSDSETGIRYRVAAALRGIHSAESVAIAKSLTDDSNADVSAIAQGTLDALSKYGLT